MKKDTMWKKMTSVLLSALAAGTLAGALTLFPPAALAAPAPQTAAEWWEQGSLLSLQKDFDGAIAAYDKAIALQPQYADAYNNRGNAYMGKGEYEKAIADFSQAIVLDPQYADAYYNRANAYSSLKQYEKAILDYTRTTDLNTMHIDAFFNRAWTGALVLVLIVMLLNIIGRIVAKKFAPKINR